MTIASQVANRLYRMGMSGDVVKAIQLGLKAVGYALNGTGYFGPATDVAVETFQKRAGLRVDGVVGQTTARALDAAVRSLSGIATVPVVTAPPLAEVGRPLWVEAGIKLVGVKEFAGARDNPVIIDWAKDEGGDIAASYTHDSIPWCALFGNHILTKVGLKGPETLWALDFNSDLMKKRVGHGWPAVPLLGPAVGAFAPMLRNGGGHIICVVGKDQHGNIMGLGGNQSDQVSIIPFPASRLNRGFWWPDSVPIPMNVGFSHLPIVRSDGKVSSKEA